MKFVEPPPSSFLKRLFDIGAELSGIYRFSALCKGNIIAISARVKSPSRLILGNNVTIQQGTILHCGGKAWSGYHGYIRIGNGVKIGPYCVIYGAGGIDLEDHVHLGPGVKLMSQAGKHDANRLTSNPNYLLDPIQVGEGSWIGASAVLLGGTQVGCCVTVSPNSVVSGIIPDYAVVVGNPCRIVFKNEALNQ
jgi:acetyltransferase-like isoleucine patch superfamily enzyme